MIPSDVLIWTPRGYKPIGDLTVGDKVISYNADKGYSEYDTIGGISTEWKRQGLIGLKQSSINLLVSPDHPLLIIDPLSKELTRIPADDLFMKKTGVAQRLLANKMFEPYKRSNDMEYIAWTARLAASSARFKRPVLYSDEINSCLADICGEEAQLWVNTFFHWNVLRSRPVYMKTILTRNDFIKDMLYHVIPRAGSGTYWGPYRTRQKYIRHVYAFSTAKECDKNIEKHHWCAERQDGLMFNMKTGNGNFLGKMKWSTMPVACNFTEVKND